MTFRGKFLKSVNFVRARFDSSTAADAKAMPIFRDKRFLFTVAVPSFLWLFVSITYLSVNMGWENLLYLLPHEIAGIVLGVFTPVLVAVILFVVFVVFSGARFIASEVRRRGDLIKDVSSVLGIMTDETRENRKIILDDMEGRRTLFRETANAIETSNVRMQEIIGTLGLVVRGGQEKMADDDSRDIGALAALAQLVNQGLADLSLAVTLLLVHLMEAEKRGETETRDYIEGLVDAWAAGDKNVYFRTLHHRLANNPEQITLLQSLATESPKVSEIISKILRGTKGFSLLAEQCDKDNVIRFVIEGSDLWALNGLLEPRFKTDGTARP